MNNINITGNLTRDAEMKQIGDSNVIEFSIANNDESKKNQSGEWEKIVSYFNCSIWSKSGKIFNHLKKGKAVSVSGKLKQEIWQDKETNKNMSKVVIRANEVIPHVYEKENQNNTQNNTQNNNFVNDQAPPF